MPVKVSVVVPVYNVEKYITACIESLKAQDCDSLEVIVVNDGSKDNSIALCEACIAGDDRFRIIHKENGGLMSAWKAGVQAATGVYIGFVDSDDWVDKNMYSVMLAEMEKSDADIVSSGFCWEYPNETVPVKRDSRFEFSGEAIRREYLKEYCCAYLETKSKPTIIRCDKLYKKEILTNNMPFFDERVSLAEDFNANMAMLLDAKKIVLLPDFAPYHYRFNPKSIMNTVNPKAFWNIKALAEICDWICREKKADTLYVDSFVGNVIYEEVKRICRGKLTKEIRAELAENLAVCDSKRYLSAYATIRNDTVTTLSCRLVRMKRFGILHALLKLKESN